MEIARREAMLGVVSVGFLGDLFGTAKVGKPAPPFTVTTFEGRRFTCEDLAGKVVVLNFWATWCAPCRIELPMLDQYLRHHPDDDLQLFAVATEDSVPNAKLKPLAEKLSVRVGARCAGSGVSQQR